MGANARVATALALIFALAFVPRVLSQDTEKPPLPVSLKTIPVPGPERRSAANAGA